MNLPKISIVVPSYNQGQFLEETLLSIINQQYPNLELMVADGGSADNSVEVIRKYEKHISWWVSEKDKGQSDAINKGLQKVTGDIVTWINSDDVLTPGALKKVAEYFSQQPGDAGLIHGGTVLFSGTKDIKTDWGYKNPSVERNLAGMAFSQPSAFFLKKYLDKVGGRVSEQLHYGMDYDLYCRLACVCRFVPVQDVFSKYRLHSNSKSVAEQDKFISDWNRVFINFCKQAGWQHEMEEIKSTGLFEESVFQYESPFSFTPVADIIALANRKLTLFYHFCYTLKSFYWRGERNKAKRLLAHLKENYPSGWLSDEKDIPAIIRKLNLPDFALRILKRIKGTL